MVTSQDKYIDTLFESMLEDLEEKKASEDDVSYLSSVDLKKELINFKNAPNETRLEKYKALYDLLSEMTLQLYEEIEVYSGDEERDESDFFEMIYDILFDNLANKNFAFFEAYLESKHKFENGIPLEESEDVLKSLFGADFNEESLKKAKPEDIKKLKDKMKDMDEEERKKVFKALGKLWKSTMGNNTIKTAAIYGLTNVNPALGFLANLLLKK